jgi:uncharacterized protein YkwD
MQAITRRSVLQAAAVAGLVSRAGKAALNQEIDFARRIFSRINEIREVNGAEALQWSDAVAECARQQSIRKLELRFPGHTDPARGGVGERLHSAGIDWARCGENIFMERGWDDPVNYAAVFWWYSPGHQENMLDADFTETGVGVVQGSDQTWFATQIFLTPPPVKMRRGNGRSSQPFR